MSVKSAPYQPGQFFFLTMKVQGQDMAHHFSFSSSPTDRDYIEFTKRITPHDFSQALDTAKVGTFAHVTGPFGNFTLPEKIQPLAFITGGIGITPVRSMLRYIAHSKLLYDMVLLYGNRSYEEITFHQELNALAVSLPSLQVEHVLSGPDYPADWKGKRGFVSKDLIVESIPDYKERLFYISGPPKMVLSLVEQLVACKIPEERIKKDSFTGYD